MMAHLISSLPAWIQGEHYTDTADATRDEASVGEKYFVGIKATSNSLSFLYREKSEGKISVYAGLDKVRFKSPVFPGDEFRTKCRIKRTMGDFYFCEGEGYVDGRLCISALFSFALADKEAVCSRKS